ncbi:hypothetical protein OKN36_21790 [Furfurilactobacillus sp. OKN36]
MVSGVAPRSYSATANTLQKRYIYEQICEQLQQSTLNDSAIARTFGVSRTVVRYIKSDLVTLQPGQS